MSRHITVNVQGGFFDWSALKMTKCQTLRKFLLFELFWRDLHVIWHLVIFQGGPVKKNTLYKHINCDTQTKWEPQGIGEL